MSISLNLKYGDFFSLQQQQAIPQSNWYTSGKISLSNLNQTKMDFKVHDKCELTFL